MSKSNSFKIFFLLVGLLFTKSVCFSQSSPLDIDFRYRPAWWQTLICLPDDPVKTLVGKEGQIFGDFRYPGPRRFSFSIMFDGKVPFLWKNQQLKSARAPIIQTVKESDGIEINEETFLEMPGEKALNSIERYDSRRSEKNWSRPIKACDASFNDIASGLRASSGEGLIEFHVKVKPGSSFDAVLGFCEGQWDTVGKRAMRIYVEGAERKDIDPVKDFGFRTPGVYSFHAKDINQDGILNIVVANKPGTNDRNVFVNAVWLFKNQAPDGASIIEGKENKNAVVYAPAATVRMPERRYHMLLNLKNTTGSNKTFSPLLRYEGIESVKQEPGFLQIGDETMVTSSDEILNITEDSVTKFTFNLKPVSLKPGENKNISITISRFFVPRTRYVSSVAITKNELIKTAAWWQKNSPSASAITVPDQGIQSVMESSLRNIFQARDIHKGNPSFHVGPTVYRGLWTADGSFMLEVAAMLNYTKDVRSCIEYLTNYQLPDGGFEMINDYHKENGLVMFMLIRYAQLTQDKAWLTANWSVIEGCIRRINFLRAEAMKDPKSPSYTLLPPGHVDGGIRRGNEYSNTEWCLGGMKWAIWGAKWLGKNEQADTWQHEYDDFYNKFMAKAKNDLFKDGKGNTYLPVMINNINKLAPEKGQWAFAHSVYPGMIFDDDSTARKIAEGTMDMLHGQREEGMVLNTGWMEQGIWTYFASFYGHALQWLGRGKQLPELLYAFGNHASPTMVWREEQKPVGKGNNEVGDMPHNWASAEFIRMTVHMIELDHGKDLHLFEGLPKQWAKAGAITKLNGIRTPFGRINLNLTVNSSGNAAKLKLQFLDKGNLPEHIKIYKESWIDGGKTETVKPAQNIEMNILIK